MASPSRGLFVTLEGGEGSGKSTQIERAAEFLRGAGQDVVVTREPGGSPGAEALRHVILSGAAEGLGREMEAVLFAAARADHVAQLIRPALDAGRTVLCDRFHDSTRVYQGSPSGAGSDLLALLETATLQAVYPDLTIVLDLPAEEGLRRASLRRGSENTADRFEKEALEAHEARREAFVHLAEAEPERCRVVDASAAADDVAVRIEEILKDFLAARAGSGTGDAESDPATEQP